MATSLREIRVRPAVAAALGLALVAVVGWVDLATGRDLSVAVFYLPAVFVAAWFGGNLVGLLIAGTATVVWLFAYFFGRPVDLGPFVPLWNALGLFLFLLVSVVGIAKLKGALRREQALSRQDPITGVANGRALMETAAREIERSQRSGRPFSLAFADCDNFKAVNDVYGHAVGDEALREVAQRIAGAVREIDVVARIGGDEFAVLLPETDGEGARAAVGRIRAALVRPLGEKGIGLTLSVGVVTFAGQLPSVEEMLRQADRLMYAAKSAGKNTSLAEISI